MALEAFKRRFGTETQHGERLLSYLSRSDCGVWRCEQDRYDPRRWWLNVTLPNQVAEMFDAHAEIQLVYVEYERVEPRLFELVQQRIRGNARLDPGLMLIASLDPQVGSLTRRRRGEFAAIDLLLTDLGADASDIRHRMSSVLTSVDHYDFSNPVRDPSGFFGRRAEFDQIIGAIERRQSVGIFGLRKTGKTSLMNFVSGRRREAGKPVIWLDISGLTGADASPLQRGTFKVKSSKVRSVQLPMLKVSADGVGVVSHAGVGLLREVAALSGLSEQVSSVLADTYRGPWVHDPGVVFGDLAAAVADGADCVSGIGALVDQQAQHGPVASVTTAWRLIDQRVDADHLVGVKRARAAARSRVWAAGAAPAPRQRLVIDIDATITLDHSDNKENSAATWKRTYGFHPLLAYLDRPDISGGEALAAMLRPGNAGSSTAADHVTVLTEALAALPAGYRPEPAAAGSGAAAERSGPDVFAGSQAPRVLVRTDSAGATHAFAKACREAGWGSPSGSGWSGRSRTR